MKVLLNNISKSFNDEKIISNFTVDFPKTGSVCLFGESGSGKTTLFNIISGILKADSGEVLGIDGKRISMVFQEDRLLPWLTAKENVQLVLNGANESKAIKILSMLGLEDAKDKKPYELSGGMQRRVAIARALVFDFDILLLDEPLKGLNKAIKKRVIETIDSFSSSKLRIIITHDQEEAICMSDVIYMLIGPPLKIAEKVEIDRSNLSEDKIEEYKKKFINV